MLNSFQPGIHWIISQHDRSAYKFHNTIRHTPRRQLTNWPTLRETLRQVEDTVVLENKVDFVGLEHHTFPGSGCAVLCQDKDETCCINHGLGLVLTLFRCDAFNVDGCCVEVAESSDALKVNSVN